MATPQVISTPAAGEHIAPCGLFCSACGKFKKGRCRGCQVEPGFSQCAVRKCVIAQGITTCAECHDMAGHTYRDCKKVNNVISRVIGFFTKSDRCGALELLRDGGREGYLVAKRESGKM
jgi:hypothetical protein